MTHYGFGGRLNASFPSQFIIDVTEVCNLACIHCPHPDFKKSVHYGAKYLDPQLHDRLVDEVNIWGKGITGYLRYTSQGEPLIHPKIFEMMGYASKNTAGALVALTTNGVLMNEKRIEKMLAAGVDVVDTSIDAYLPETYERIRVNGDLEVTRGNVLKLLKMREQAPKKLKVVVSYVEQPQNTNETDSFEKYWKDQGADYVVIRRLHSCAGAKQEKATEMRREEEDEARRPCLYPWERISLDPSGNLKFCPEDWVHGSKVADYRTTTIKEAWQGEFMTALRQAHLTNDFAKHSFCGQCPDWKATRWPGEGRSYADMMQQFQAS
jgi:MoaA/NifB/PqqE/SkfB family radical SAM enzyme